MSRLIALFPAALVAALVCGYGAAWLAPAHAPSNAERPPVTVAVEHGGRAIAAAAFELGSLRDPAPQAESLPDSATPSPPPEPDVAETFRRELTAVVRRNGRAYAVLVDVQARSGRRVLGIGSVYRDGWKVRAISEAAIELKRRRDVRRIDVFAPPASDDPGADEGALVLEPAPRRFLARDANASMQKE